MERPNPRDLLATLSMPLRDVARGLRAAGHATEPLLRNAGDVLPGGMADAMRKTVERAGEFGARGIGVSDPSHAEIISASDALVNRTSGLPAVAKTVVAALQHLIEHHPEKPQMISETVTAMAIRSAFAKLPADAPSAEAGAAVVGALLQAHAVGQFPGTPLASGDTSQSIARRAVVSSVLWLLADRAEDLTQDIALLDLCEALVEGLETDAESAMEDPASLAELLAELADVV